MFGNPGPMFLQSRSQLPLTSTWVLLQLARGLCSQTPSPLEVGIKVIGAGTAPWLGETDPLEAMSQCSCPSRPVLYPLILVSTGSLISNRTQLAQKRAPTRALPTSPWDCAGLFPIQGWCRCFFPPPGKGLASTIKLVILREPTHS